MKIWEFDGIVANISNIFDGGGEKCIFVCGRFSGRGDKLCSRSKKDISSSRGTKFLHFALWINKRYARRHPRSNGKEGYMENFGGNKFSKFIYISVPRAARCA